MAVPGFGRVGDDDDLEDSLDESDFPSKQRHSFQIFLAAAILLLALASMASIASLDLLTTSGNRRAQTVDQPAPADGLECFNGELPESDRWEPTPLCDDGLAEPGECIDSTPTSDNDRSEDALSCNAQPLQTGECSDNEARGDRDNSTTAEPCDTEAPDLAPDVERSEFQTFRIAGTTGTAKIGGGNHFSTQQKGDQKDAGVRSHCAASHFSYDDPIANPGQPGASHLHMFWGNTSVDANSTNGTSQRGNTNHLAQQKQSTCSDLGRYNNSGYWIPALFNADGQVVVPDDIKVYYKTHESGGNPDPAVFDIIKPIPNDLSMVSPRASQEASRTFLGSSGNTINASISFHDCIQTNKPNAVDPQQRYNTTYVDENSDSCPSGFTRIPRTVINVHWKKTPANGLNVDGWVFSDGSTASNYQNLHADYMASWSSDAARQQLITCNRNKQACVPENEQSNLDSIRNVDGQKLMNQNVLIPSFATPSELAGLPTHTTRNDHKH